MVGTQWDDTKRRAGRPGGLEDRSPARIYVQPAGPPYCAACPDVQPSSPLCCAARPDV